MMANSMHDLKHALGGFRKIFGGAAFHKQDYVDLLSLLYFLRTAGHHQGQYGARATYRKTRGERGVPEVPEDHGKPLCQCTMICDYLRMVGMNADDPNQIEDVMARELKKTLHEELHGAHALQMMADGLPALGIVAAVLGVIKTMSHIDRPPAILGAMIASALCGTFLGVLLAYGLAGPCACRLQAVVEEEAKFYEVIRAVLVTHLHGNAPQVSVESGRKMVPNAAHADIPGIGGGGAVGPDQLR